MGITISWEESNPSFCVRRYLICRDTLSVAMMRKIDTENWKTIRLFRNTGFPLDFIVSPLSIAYGENPDMKTAGYSPAKAIQNNTFSEVVFGMKPNGASWCIE